MTTKSIFDFTVKSIDNDDISIAQFRKPNLMGYLVVNTASA